MQPGETVTPGSTAAPQPAAPAPQPPVPAPEASVPDAPPAEAQQTAPAQDDESISWTASEYLIHHKNFGWFISLGLITAALGIVVWFVTQDVVSVTVVGIVGMVFGIAAARQPRVLTYRVDQTGLHMGEKSYPYADFKSFSVIEEGQMSSITLMPMKRFMPGVSIYYPPEQEDDIANVLALYLPHEERKPDMVDRLMHKVRY
jgi:hypothetical protein